MRKLIVAWFGIAALAAALRPAAAADLPMIYRPQQTYVIFTWTGFYFGVHGGGGWGQKEVTAAPFPVGGGINFVQSAVTANPSGWIAGAQIGANYQVGSWVFGFEADGGGADLSGNATCSHSLVGIVTVTANCSAKVNSLGTVAGRLGIALDRMLVYGKGGGAWANDQYQLNSALLAFNANETRWGWMVGAGVEYSFTDTWSAKIEYNYLDFGTRAIRFTDTTGLFNLDTNISERIHVVKAGINYRFGWAPVGVTY
jgi:outer membrane immunogenic protein